MAGSRYPSPSQVAAAVERQGAAYVDRLVAEVEAQTPVLLRRRLDAIVRTARFRWPVGPTRKGRRGHSRDLFTVRVDEVGPKVVGVITNDARDEKGRFYVAYILSAKNGLAKDRSAWNQLVVTPTRAAAAKVADDMVVLVQRAGREAERG